MTSFDNLEQEYCVRTQAAVTDVTYESGYIKAHNRKQRIIYGKDAKECPK